MFESVPQEYDETYLNITRQGARVLALGIKDLGQLTHQQASDFTRDECENSLQFAGFVVISCPLKRDSKGIIKELLNASHHVVMITGDNALTACHVAKELKFTCKDKGSPGMAIMAKSSQDESCSSWEFQTVEGACIASVPPPSPNSSKSLLSGLKTSLSKHDVCVTGDGLAYLQKEHP